MKRWQIYKTEMWRCILHKGIKKHTNLWLCVYALIYNNVDVLYVWGYTQRQSKHPPIDHLTISNMNLFALRLLYSFCSCIIINKIKIKNKKISPSPLQFYCSTQKEDNISVPEPGNKSIQNTPFLWLQRAVIIIGIDRFQNMFTKKITTVISTFYALGAIHCIVAAFSMHG